MGVPFALRSCAAGDAATQVSSRKEIPKVLFPIRNGLVLPRQARFRTAIL
eukprot:COSAG06_NODE_4273_length_4410_cov_5.289754_5_plen_50_part_00